jgi:20S proteasome alpha/beta subunit
LADSTSPGEEPGLRAAGISDYSLSILVAGATDDKELRAYHIHSIGLAESIEGYGTTGSGAVYAELFLHGFIPEPSKRSTADAVRLVSFAIKGVEIMDPHVGGDTRVCTMQMIKDKLTIVPISSNDLPAEAKEKMEGVLRKIGTDMRELVEKISV